MALIFLKKKDRGTLEQLLSTSKNVRQFRRVQGILWLADGHQPEKVANRLRVSRSTVYDWATRWNQREEQAIPERLLDKERSGCPRKIKPIMESAISGVLTIDPKKYGYRYSDWTVGLLQLYLKDVHQVSTSKTTVRRCLRRLGYRWKRPRFVLSRRSPHWRQAKGG